MMRRAIEQRWAFVPVAFLLATVAFAVFATTLALRDPSAYAAEPDYYKRGADYDSYKQQIAENGVIGWVITPSIVAAQGDPRLARVEIAVADKYGIAIEGATATVEVIPIRDADARVQLALVPVGGGRYAADVPVRSGGQWEVRVEIRCKGKVFADRFRRQVHFGARQAAVPSGGGA